MRTRSALAVPVLLALATHVARATDIAPSFRASIQDSPIDGLGDSFNVIPFTGLVSKSSPQAESRAIQEFNVSLFAGASIQTAVISGKVTFNNSVDVGLRTFDFLLYAANGNPDLADFQIAATYVGSGSYYPPTPPDFTYSFDVTTVVQAMLDNGTQWVGLKVVCTSDPNAPNILDDATSKIAITLPVQVGIPYCFGYGPSTPCPCGNDSPTGSLTGCLSSLGVGGKLIATGVSSLSNDTVALVGTQMPNSSALYFQGTAQAGTGVGTLFGDGLRCATGTVVRLGTNLNVNNASHYPSPGQQPVHTKGGLLTSGTRYYQVWYRNAAPFCLLQTFNLTNGWTLQWTL
jgi:hypothetical protein